MKIMIGENFETLIDYDITNGSLSNCSVNIRSLCSVHAEDIDETGFFEIPEGITHISNRAFICLEDVRHIHIPKSVIWIGEFAFSHCHNLTSLEIPESVTDIGEFAFNCCHNLMSLEIPDNVTDIGAYAFADCSRLTHLTIPRNITRINEYLFLACERLETVTLPPSLTNIENAPFCLCNELSNILIDVDTIEEYKKVKSLLPESHQNKAKCLSPVRDFYIRTECGEKPECPSLIDFSIFAFKKSASNAEVQEVKDFLSNEICAPHIANRI